MTGSGEAAHVGADFGDDDLPGEVTDARDGPQLADGLTERVEIAVDLRVDLGDGGVERINLAQMQAQQEAAAFGDAPQECRAQFLRRSLDAALHESEQRVSGSLSINAWRMARPVTPMIWVSTEPSLRVASSSVFWMR
jgi:hypothetical protein